MGKYDKYFVETLPGTGRPEWSPPGGPAVLYLDDKVIKGCNWYTVMLVPNVNPSGGKWDDVSHGPNIHKDAEIIFFIGTNPENPTDLGAEVEFCMGEEMEKHVITKTCAVFIPAGFISCPMTLKRVDRPWVLINLMQGPMFTEKSYPQIVSEKDRDKMVFIDFGYGEENKVILPKHKGV